MFEKVLSSFGIGSAKVKTVLLNTNIERGMNVEGEVHITGGKAEQKISEIYIHIDSEFHNGDDDYTDFKDVIEPLLEIKITNPLVINPHDKRIIPFSFEMPFYMPITFGIQEVTIKTEVNINHSLHDLVEDHSVVVKDPLLEEIFSILEEKGYSHTFKSGQCRHRKPDHHNPTHCLQTFTLTNSKGVSIHFVGNAKDIDLYITEGKQVTHFPILREVDLPQILIEFGKRLPSIL
ncbi:sporulation protein [Bacillus sp. Marseille-P3661]|uniref:sporulation protein n=1 Tax=Bacillus sp. Marseille-P3661 TaxID=1936234 RepID=UPI000C8274E4|nr:sporulation protein [Bacillus sp. Marseille-P3661]